MKRVGCFFLSLLLMLACGCGQSSEQSGRLPAGQTLESGLHRYQGSFLGAFDTVTTVVLYGESEAWAQEKIEEIRTELLRYHQLYDIYNAYEGVNNLYTVNENAGMKPVQVGGDIMGLLKFAKEMYDLTGGRTNVAMGSVLAIWHSYREAGIDRPEEAALPPMEGLEAAARHTDINDVILDEAAQTVYLRDPELRLDVGAVAKGYAGQRVAEKMRAEGVTSLLMSIGGNVCGVGRRADGADWRVTVQSPEGTDYLCCVRVNGTNLVTSGTYQRYYTVDGKRYAHIIDPETLMPAERFDSVSVLCPDSGQADALSTALCSMTLEEGMELIESLPDTEALWLDGAGKETMSGGFAGYVIPEEEIAG